MQKSDYELDEKTKIILTDIGVDKIEKLALQNNILKNNNFYDPANLELVHHPNNIKGQFNFKKDAIVVRDGKVQIIDEFEESSWWKKFSLVHQAIRRKKM